MNTWVDRLISEYHRFLRDRTAVITETGTEWVVVSTPFVGAFNDNIEIYMKRADDKIIMSDDGATLRNLDLQGFNVTRSSKRRDILDRTLLTYGVKHDNGELFSVAVSSNFAHKKHNLLMAIAEISDMYVLSKHSVSSIFKEDVKLFLEEKEIVYTPQFIFKGRTGFEFAFDFQIAHRGKEIVIKSFNSMSKSTVSNFLFSWDDVRAVREQMTNKNLTGVAFINDADGLKAECLEALRSRDAECILWSQRDSPESIRKLVA